MRRFWIVLTSLKGCLRVKSVVGLFPWCVLVRIIEHQPTARLQLFLIIHRDVCASLLVGLSHSVQSTVVEAGCRDNSLRWHYCTTVQATVWTGDMQQCHSEEEVSMEVVFPPPSASSPSHRGSEERQSGASPSSELQTQQAQFTQQGQRDDGREGKLTTTTIAHQPWLSC